MGPTFSVFKRELTGYFATPVAYVFIGIFLFLNGLFTFQLGGFYEGRQADLGAFFNWHPWLYLFLIPAVSMRLWAEERRSGTIELLLTLPISLGQAILGKFLAAWVFIGAALALTFPIVCTVAYLGSPDMGVIAAGYVGSFLMAGAYLAIGCCISAATKNQVISFIIAVLICFIFQITSFPAVMDWFSNWAPQVILDAVADLSFQTHFASISRGVIQLNSVIFFALMIGAWLYGCAVFLEAKKAE